MTVPHEHATCGLETSAMQLLGQDRVENGEACVVVMFVVRAIDVSGAVGVSCLATGHPGCDLTPLSAVTGVQNYLAEHFEEMVQTADAVSAANKPTLVQ